MKKSQSWLKLPLELLQKEDLSMSAKVVYIYMLWRFQFFNSNKAKYFESQDTIAQACGVSRKTVNESIHKLVELGWMTCTRSTLPSSLYEVKDVFLVYDRSQKRKEEYLEEPF